METGCGHSGPPWLSLDPPLARHLCFAGGTPTYHGCRESPYRGRQDRHSVLFEVTAMASTVGSASNMGNDYCARVYRSSVVFHCRLVSALPHGQRNRYSAWVPRILGSFRRCGSG